MLRSLVIVVIAVLGLAAAGPATVRSRKDIEAFKQYLEKIRNGTSKLEQFLARKKSYPNANEEELGGWYQGDIILDEVDVETMFQEYAVGRAAYSTSTINFWPGNTVIFEFGSGEFNEQQQAAIWEAVRDIENHTCVKFRYRTSESVYVKLTGANTGCSAHIGYRTSRGAHTMNLARAAVGTGCFRHATIVHEWMHILGFLHMHATYDRDQYVKILKENVLYGTEHNFDIYEASKVNNLDVEYDYVSCMHYGPYSFTGNGKPTIQALKPFEGEMGQRDYVTDKDWLRINRYYNCPGAWD